MSDILLTTKFFIPSPRIRLIARPRLITRIDEGLHRKLTLISAPAGFGKTTLISNWVDQYKAKDFDHHHPETNIAWLSLDEKDNDPVRFLTYFITSLKTPDGIDQSFGGSALRTLQSPQPAPTETILSALINELYSLPNRIILILDDYHLVSAPEIDDLLTFLLERQPPQLHLVITTRIDPTLPLARMRALGQLNELRARDLKFTSDEAKLFLNEAMALALTQEEIDALEDRTEGWIAGLQLAAVSIRHLEDKSSLIKAFTGSHRLILDYLVEEVFEQLSETEQNFLLKTAILERMNSAVCKILTGQNDAQSILERLERSNLFIVPLDHERNWYRYHNLFADVLRQRLNLKFPESIRPLHLHASEWFESNGLHDEAVEHAFEGSHFDAAARIISNHIQEKWQQGKIATLQNWLKKLPSEIICANPKLSIFQAWVSFINGDQDGAETYLKTAHDWLDSHPVSQPRKTKHMQETSLPSEGNITGIASAIRAVMATYRSNGQEAMHHASKALKLLPPEDINWRSAALTALADAHVFMGEYEKAHQARFDSLKESKAAGNTYLYLVDGAKSVLVQKARGKLHQAEEMCKELLEHSEREGFSTTETAGWIKAILGEILTEMDQLDEAENILRQGVDLAQNGRDIAFLTWSYMCLTRFLFTTGDYAGAEKLIDQTQNMAQNATVPPWVKYQMITRQVQIWLAEGRLDHAQSWLDAHNQEPELAATYVGSIINLPISRIKIASGNTQDVDDLLNPILAVAEKGGHVYRILEISILQCLKYGAQGDIPNALKSLERALSLGKPGGFIRIFTDEGKPMARLLYEAIRKGIYPNYAQQVATAFRFPKVGIGPDERDEQKPTSLIEPLSPREIEVLSLISAGLTNQEIAEQLCLSQNTIKVHIRNIFGKLGVTNRTQALVKAKTFGILH